MEKTIYADSLFIINFCVDALSLYAGGRICGQRVTKSGITIASILGGLYSVAAAYYGLSGIISAAVGFGAAAVMCFCAYGGLHRLRTLLLSVMSFYSANLLLGGCLEAVYSLSGKKAAPRFGAVIAAAALGCFAIRELCARGRRARSAETAECGITLCGSEKKVRLLCDSGNLLRDPYNGNSVIILSGRVFPDITEKLKDSDLIPLSAAKPRIIPASFAGGTGILYGLVPEKVSLKAAGGTYIPIEATVALAQTDSDFGGNDGIIPASLVI